MCESIALAALAFMHHAPLAAFYGIAVAGGTLLALDNPVRRSFVNEMVPTDEIPNAVTLYSAMNSMARIADRPRRPAHRDGRLRVVLHGSTPSPTRRSSPHSR